MVLKQLFVYLILYLPYLITKRGFNVKLLIFLILLLKALKVNNCYNFNQINQFVRNINYAIYIQTKKNQPKEINCDRLGR